MDAPAEHVWIYREGDDWVIGDEGGEFARASTVEMALPYVRDLMYGPGTDATVERAWRELLGDDETPRRAWTWWDRLVHRVTGHVSNRVFEDHLRAMAHDESRIIQLEARATNQ